ncbi:MFS transporter [Sphingobium fuliginis]|jgi:MFS family permease|uniref:MFS transporter n=1 Tax=Sphingobium fuliginis (strain ATCC 27551) TaxID=336203 RepID=A0A7M2GPA8_SPHSA|nr:MFS transporter [Sphingobium fuliginis]QOT73932.1 MFS transporter [Sphingobium fuliginis]
MSQSEVAKPARRAMPTWAILTTLLTAEFTSAFELTMIYSGMKTFITIFGDPVGVGWLITVYLLVGSGSAAICGRLGDIYGRKRVLMIVLALAFVGSVVSALSHTLLAVLAGRTLQGFAGAILPLCYGLMRESLPEDRVPFGVGILAASVTVAAAAGVIVGGVLIDHFPWNAIFITSATMALVGLILCAIVLPRSQPQPRTGPLDLKGGALFIPPLFMILIGITFLNRYGLGLSSPSLWLLVGGIGLLMVWIRHELRTENPLIDLRLLGNRNVALATLAMCAYAMGPQQSQMSFLLMQQSSRTGVGLDLSGTLTGLVTLPGMLAGVFFAPWLAKVCVRVGSKKILIWAGIILLGAVGMIFPSILGLGPAGLFIQFLLQGMGSVALFASAPNVVVAEVPASKTSGATGLLQVNRSVAQAVGSQTVISLLATSTVHDPLTGAGPFPSFTAYLLTASVLLIVASGTLICGMLLRSREQRVSVGAVA